MKKFLVCTLILPMIFPAYCFANPQTSIPSEEEILEEVMFILEDGIVEKEEITLFLEKVKPDGITECVFLISSVSFIILLLSQLDFSGSAGDILLDAIILYVGLRALLLLYLIGVVELNWCG